METEYRDDPKFLRDMDIAAAYKENQLYSAYFRAMAELSYRLEGLRE